MQTDVPTINPQQIWAFVVGISEYQMSRLPNLNYAPTDEAKYLTDWLLERGVLPSHILLYLSPFISDDHWVQLKQGEGLSIQSATQQNICTDIQEKLLNSETSGDLLYLFWGGHGLQTDMGELSRCLYYSDTSDKNGKTLNLDSLIKALHKPRNKPGFSYQVYWIDACAEYPESKSTFDSALYKASQNKFSSNEIIKNNRQFILYASRGGERAYQRIDKQSSYSFFARALFDALPTEKEPQVHAKLIQEMKDIARQVRAEVETKQTQKSSLRRQYVVFNEKDWDGETLNEYRPILAPPKQPQLKLISIISLIVILLVMSLRWLGCWTDLELYGYDRLMQQRVLLGTEERDDRFLIVEVTGEDRDYQVNLASEESKKQGKLLPEYEVKGYLSDKLLFELLEKLKASQPRVIGLYLQREESSYPNLNNLLKTDPIIVSVCGRGQQPEEAPSVRPAPEIPQDRLGFNDVVIDYPANHLESVFEKGVMRRQRLFKQSSKDPKQLCRTGRSFHWLLTERYLNAEAKLFPDGRNLDLDLDSLPILDSRNNPVRTINFLDSYRGGYRSLCDNDFTKHCYELLINYQVAVLPEAIVGYRLGQDPKLDQRVTLQQVLGQGEFQNHPISSAWVKDKIVLISTTDEQSEIWTPLGFTRQVFAQAQMTSHLLSLIKGERLPIWAMTWLMDGIVSLGWSILTGFLVHQMYVLKYVLEKETLNIQPLQKNQWIIVSLLVVSLSLNAVLTWIVSLFLLRFLGLWAPLVPALLASSFSTVILVIYLHHEQTIDQYSNAFRRINQYSNAFRRLGR